MRNPVFAALFALATLAACSSSPTARTDGGAADFATNPGADGAAPGYYLPPGYTLTPFLSEVAEHTFGGADSVIDAGNDYLAVLETDAGRMVLDLLDQETPITVNSFVFLARHHYFDGIAFHRVIAGFMAQAGDPNTLQADTKRWGSGGPGYGFGLEVEGGLKFDGAGVLGMARTANPNSNGSQFFITFAAQPSLDGKYTVFGRLTNGMDTLGKVVKGEPPAAPTRMVKVYVVEKKR